MDTIQNYKCPCCGDSLVFNNNMLNCESCGNSFPIETMQQMTEAQGETQGSSSFDWEHYEPRSYEDTSGVTLANYACPSCGAEISGDDTLGATVCPYIAEMPRS